MRKSRRRWMKRVFFSSRTDPAGFRINGIFQDRFSCLPDWSRWAAVCAFLLMTTTVGLLISPAMWHRLVHHGEASRLLLDSTTGFAAVALLPLAVSLCIDLYIAVENVFCASAAPAIAVVFLCGALLTWYLIPFLVRKPDMERPCLSNHARRSTPRWSRC